MVQYRNGTFTSTGAAVNLNLGFIPDRIRVQNQTKSQAASGVGESEWNNTMPAASAYQMTIGGAGAMAFSYITTNGFTKVQLGADWQNTQYTITGITNASPGVVTLSSLTPTNTLTLVNGMIGTISGVKGMTPVNQNRFVVAQVGVAGATKFALYDLQGNPFDTTSLGTYTSGGIFNVISYPATAPTINATTGQITAQGNPPGNQYDIGYEGITLGTSVVGSNNDVLFWEAWTQTPTGW